MYAEKITLFNRYKSSLGDIWYPTVLHGVNLIMDKAAIISRYGAESKDNAILNVRYMNVTDKKMIDGKEWMAPKEWKRQSEDMLPDLLTFTSGTAFDFFMLGDYGSTEPVADSNYTDGFYNHINKEYDFVFAITSATHFSVIPHFEITGK